jgi:UDP-N-acetylmuramate dehydrogenase
MDIRQNYSLQPYNTFGLPAEAKTFLSCSSIQDVQEAIQHLSQTNQSLFILGGGSNILLTQNPEGAVLKMDIKGKEVVKEDEQSVYLRVGAGENWHQLVLFALENNWGGIENLSLIPGTVGAAPMQNIGAYGVEIEQVFDHLRAVDRKTGEIVTFGREECQFGYRESIFKTTHKDKYIICDVTFRLVKPPHKLNVTYGAITTTLQEMKIVNPTIQDVSKAVISIRKSKLPDPAIIGNSGSFFKNPTIPRKDYEILQEKFPDIPGYPVDDDHRKVPAGWLIEKCGWKGYERNGIGVHKLQALVLVNYGTGKGADIWALAHEIQDSVKETFDITLHPEVNII